MYTINPHILCKQKRILDVINRFILINIFTLHFVLSCNYVFFVIYFFFLQKSTLIYKYAENMFWKRKDAFS